ncbi:hypothetical protein OESDEN_16811, partial [Oesophagostomum dentatum]
VQQNQSEPRFCFSLRQNHRNSLYHRWRQGIVNKARTRTMRVPLHVREPTRILGTREVEREVPTRRHRLYFSFLK